MTKLKDNRDELVAVTVAGRIAPPRIHTETPAVDDDGRLRLLPGTGGVAVGVHAGDPVDAWIADHLMPGASIEDADGTPAVAGPLHLLSALGNKVRDARGEFVGIVAGKRGGLAPGGFAPQLVGVEITDATAQRLSPGDRIVVETLARGLALADHPDIVLMNLSPGLLDALPLAGDAGGLSCAVRAIVPPEIAGPGLGQDSWIGDLELAGNECLAGSVDALCFGDLVAFDAIDAATTRFYRPGFLSIGVVSHGPSHVPGHGIGVTILLTGPSDRLAAKIDTGASIGGVLRQWAERGLRS
jgi:Domain of unknown function (DUF4438), N-terminal/Domain of unknown function (DUF4438), C-terminal